MKPGSNGLPGAFWAHNGDAVASNMLALARALGSGGCDLQPLATATFINTGTEHRPSLVADSDLCIMDTVVQHRLVPAVRELVSVDGVETGQSLLAAATRLKLAISLVALGRFPGSTFLAIENNHQEALEKLDVLKHKGFPPSLCAYYEASTAGVPSFTVLETTSIICD